MVFQDSELARLRPLLSSRSQELQEAMLPLVEAMQGISGRGRFKITCLSGEESISWAVDHQAGKAARAASGESKKSGKALAAMCEAIADEGTLRAIFAGELSPLEALMQNRMRLRGDLDYGRLILRHLAVRPGMRTEICR